MSVSLDGCDHTRGMARSRSTAITTTSVRLTVKEST